MALSSARREHPGDRLGDPISGVRGSDGRSGKRHSKTLLGLGHNSGVGRCNCTCIYGILGKMFLALGAEGFGKKAGWDGGWDAMVGQWDRAATATLRACNDNDAGIPTRDTIFSLTANRDSVNA